MIDSTVSSCFAWMRRRKVAEFCLLPSRNPPAILHVTSGQLNGRSQNLVTPPDLRNSYVLRAPRQNKICAIWNWLYIWSNIYIYMEVILFEISTPTLWNLMGCSNTATPLVLSPSSILSKPSSYCTFIHNEKFATLSKNFISVFLPVLFLMSKFELACLEIA